MIALRFALAPLILAPLLALSPASLASPYATGPLIQQEGESWRFVPLARFTQSIIVLEQDPTPERIRALRAATDDEDELEEIPVYWRHTIAELDVAYVFVDMYAQYNIDTEKTTIKTAQVAPQEPDNCGYCQVLWNQTGEYYAIAQNLIVVGLHEAELAPEIARITGAELLDYGEHVATMRAPDARDLYLVYQRLADLTHLRYVSLGIVR